MVGTLRRLMYCSVRVGQARKCHVRLFLKDSTVRLDGSLAADVMICDKFKLADDTLTLS